MALTPKQARFVEEYLIDLNATAAYKRAGYKADGHAAEANASRLLSIAEVQQSIQAQQEKRSGKVELTQEWVLESLIEVVQRCMQRVPVLDSQGKQVTDASGKGVWTFQAKAATQALHLLGKHRGMFGDRLSVEHSGAVKVYVSPADGEFNPDEA